MEQLITAYRQAHKRLLLLDYDGTLADLRLTPSEAKPTPELLATLDRLAQDGRNTVVIVSGRRHEELEEWLGGLRLSFAAEHGLLVKDHGQQWSLTKKVDTTWKTSVLTIMQPYVSKIAGSLIEDKTNSLVWHYRNAPDQHEAEIAEKQLTAELQALAGRFGLRVMLGSKIVEVQPLGTTKGLAAKHWLGKGDWDFVLAAGDDTTDEDMFKAMPPGAYTTKIGQGDSAAALHIPTPHDMLLLLRSFDD